MFRDNGDPIIVDFGIAKIVDKSQTQAKMTMGTANYMSPEQCRGAKDIDGRSDIYSVGIMLLEGFSLGSRDDVGCGVGPLYDGLDVIEGESDGASDGWDMRVIFTEKSISSDMSLPVLCMVAIPEATM